MSDAVFRIQHAIGSHAGAVRRVNEDVAIVRQQAGLWAVADGMGGHAGGQWCANTIAEALTTVAPSASIDRAALRVVLALARANNAIYAASAAAGAPMGSTVAALLIHKSRYAALWAGDSRVYLCRDRRLRSLTSDHSQVERMIGQGLLDRGEARNHPLRHVLSRSVGTASAVVLDRVDGTVMPGDMFLLCSDGLSNEVTETEIAAALLHGSPREAIPTLIDMAIARGAPDNVTAIILNCDMATQFGTIKFGPD